MTTKGRMKRVIASERPDLEGLQFVGALPDETELCMLPVRALRRLPEPNHRRQRHVALGCLGLQVGPPGEYIEQHVLVLPQQPLGLAEAALPAGHILSEGGPKYRTAAPSCLLTP
eukprot:scaffold73881_cov28-Prasinocladus_malaysianus.AAC.1